MYDYIPIQLLLSEQKCKWNISHNNGNQIVADVHSICTTSAQQYGSRTQIVVPSIKWSVNS